MELPELSPPSNVGMIELDRTKFDRTLPLVVAEIEDVRMLTRIVKESAANDLLNMSRISKIVTVEPNRRGVLLNSHISDPATASKQLQSPTLQLLDSSGVKYSPCELSLGYDYWSADEVLHSVLPEELGEVPSGFAIVGHIAHLNLREQFLPYKHLIGQILLDKNKSCVRTVVNKLDSIHAVYRTFDMEVIAGEPYFVVEQQESGCRFEFDFRKVYWNSRLHMEHDRLVKLFGSGKAICDPMAGVGPFAVPAAKRGNIVFANDLNPESYASMNRNIELNKLNPEVLQTFNEDGREFIRQSIPRLHAFRQQHLGEQIRVNSDPPRKNRSGKIPESKTVGIPEYFSHYVMNLPATAIEFLDAFRGLYTNQKFSEQNPPLPAVHVHCFYKFEPHMEEPEREVVHAAISERVSRALGYNMAPKDISLHDVRRVAPTKDMYEVSFVLPREVCYAKR